MRKRDLTRYYAGIAPTWARQSVNNSWGIANVADLIWLRPMPGGLVPADHPFCTGAQPDGGAPIWPANLIFRAERRAHIDAPARLQPEPDRQILERVGRFMSRMFARSAASSEHPSGRPARMPHAINYLHGGVHYNGGWMIFDDFRQAIEVVSDRAFRRELRRFVATEEREPLMVFRQRAYDRREFAELVCFLRTVLPWFCNSNGPKKRVLWGNPAPYPVVNVITGHWITDVRRLAHPLGRVAAVRPPISAGAYFQGEYRGWRDRPLWPERALATLTEARIRARGERGNLFFVDARRLRKSRADVA